MNFVLLLLLFFLLVHRLECHYWHASHNNYVNINWYIVTKFLNRNLQSKFSSNYFLVLGFFVIKVWCNLISYRLLARCFLPSMESWPEWLSVYPLLMFLLLIWPLDSRSLLPMMRSRLRSSEFCILSVVACFLFTNSYINIWMVQINLMDWGFVN